MNKYKIIALLLVLAMSLCLFSACGDSATPGEKNDKLISETPDDLDIVDDELKKGAEEVTAITGQQTLTSRSPTQRELSTRPVTEYIRQGSRTTTAKQFTQPVRKTQKATFFTLRTRLTLLGI